ncbi:MAG: DUF2071 domain-containing protein [Acidobacteriota bacterium]
MYLRTRALDCLYVNWALPREVAPALPPPLRYEVHQSGGVDYVFASTLLFHLSGLRLETLPFLRLSYPQMNCRVYVLDGDGVPSVLFRRILVPAWVVTASRWLSRQPTAAARFAYPRPSKGPRSDAWSWSVHNHQSLELAGKLASPRFGPGPNLGAWEITLDYFRQRPRGYVLWKEQLRPIATSKVSVEVWPLQVEVGSAGLVAECFPDATGDVWGVPHSAWLCPEIPFIFELGELRTLQLPRRRATAASGF